MTDRRRLSGTSDPVEASRCLMRQIAHAVDAQVDVVQIRERDLDAAALADIARSAVSITRGTRTRVVVNDRLDVALAVRADGVHLRSDSFSAAAARTLAPRGFLIGLSVHSAREAMMVRTDVDYLIAGTVWPTASKPDGRSTLGVGGLADVVNATGLPVLAIGGVTVERAAEVASAGVAGFAAIGMFMGPGEAQTAGFCRAVPLIERVAEARERFDTFGSAS